MINILIGPPGGGKSYEAVAYHVLVALASGRKVITNLPLNLDYIGDHHPEYLALIEIRQKTLKIVAIESDRAGIKFQKFGGYQKQVRINNAAFSNAEDYGDLWRHPETGSGPLYVIDECHIPLPKMSTPLEVEHWYSLHRHESADVLLMTQSYGKINPAIRDLIQICYKVKKNTAFGSANSYVRKVQDGLRGEVVNTSIRKYEKKYFAYYQSHTKGGGSELAAQDIIPIWRRWPFMGAALMFTIFFIMLGSGMLKNPMNAKSYNQHKNEKVKTEETVSILSSGSSSINIQASSNTPISNNNSQNSKAIQAKESEKELTDPYASNGIHIVGHVQSRTKSLWVLALSQNGQILRNIKSDDLVSVGYGFQALTDCAAWLSFEGQKRFY